MKNGEEKPSGSVTPEYIRVEKSSSRLRLPEGARRDFGLFSKKIVKDYQGRGLADSIVDKERLFMCFKHDEGSVSRHYFTYKEGELKGGDWRPGRSLVDYLKVLESDETVKSQERELTLDERFDFAHSLEIDDSYFRIKHQDVTDRNRMISQSSGLRLERKKGGQVEFGMVFRDQFINIDWDEKGAIRSIDLFVGEHFKGHVLEIGGPGQRFGIVFENGKPFWVPHPDLRQELTNGRRTIHGRPVDIDDGDKFFKLAFYRVDEPEVLDYEVSIPKTQEMETMLDHKAEEVTRYTWETDLIPEALRRNPFQPVSEIDDVWMRADIIKLLEIDIKKNNPESSSLGAKSI